MRQTRFDMPPKRLLFFCASISLLLLFFACAQKKDTGAGGAPGGLLPGVSAPQGFKFPHPEGTADPSVHGIWVNEAGIDMCLGCHKVDKDENSATPSCRSCHPLYPHEDNWVAQEKHGSRVVASGQADCATRCHGADLAGGLSKISCIKCHSIYPHAQNFSDSNVHGEEAKGSGKLICKPCHGDDYLGGQSKASCFKCHKNYPHAQNWALGENHGSLVLRDGEQLCATTCHGADFAGGKSGVSCSTCHGMYPHPEGWDVITSHGEASAGDAKVTCQSCHGGDFRGGTSGVPCFGCHGNYPHPSGWISGNLHGAPVLASGERTCATECHGADFAGGNSGVTCRRCHEYPHTDPSWASRENPLHARTFRQKMSDGASADCTVCHGANLDRDLGGGRCTNTACHGADFGHPDSAGAAWGAGEGHGSFLTSGGFRSEAASATCFACHGDPLIFQQSHTDVPPGDPNKVTAERDFLKRASDCYRCHWSYPHIEWNEGSDALRAWRREIECEQHLIGSAHIDYLSNSPLMIDAGGRSMISWEDPPETQTAVINYTCGREDGFCHFNGAKSYRTPFGSLCSALCHSAIRPVRPVLPDCEPPTGRQLPRAPRVAQVRPRDGAVDVYAGLPSIDIEVRFNEPMRRDTILAGESFYLQRESDSSRINGDISCSRENWCMVATLSNFGALDSGTRYSIHVTPTAQDWQGARLASFTSVFTTAPAAGPVVVSVIPTGTVSTDIPRIRATFDRTVKCLAGAECFTLTRVGDSLRIGGSTSCAVANCTFTPSARLSYSETYEVTATTAIQDLAGNHLSAPYTWRFSIGARP